MCEKCVAAVRTYFPDCPDDKMGSFLFSATCFPAGDDEQVIKQLKEAHDAGAKTWQEAIGYANMCLEEDMLHMHIRDYMKGIPPEELWPVLKEFHPDLTDALIEEGKALIAHRLTIPQESIEAWVAQDNLIVAFVKKNMPKYLEAFRKCKEPLNA